MTPFNVLDRSTHILKNHLIEASAGTGKTFSIQNIVARLLIESNHGHLPLQIHHILVVTFTRASTRDLKLRIRKNLEEALGHLNQYLSEGAASPQIPDYLLAITEKGVEATLVAKRLLQQALFEYDQAQIFTIHSFCAKMLRHQLFEVDLAVHSFCSDTPLSASEYRKIVRNFFLTGIRKERYSPAQMEILLKKDPDQWKLIRAMKVPHGCLDSPVFSENFRHFVDLIAALKKKYFLKAEEMIEDFKRQSECYRNLKPNLSKAALHENIARFAHLVEKNQLFPEDFDELIRHGFFWVDALDASLEKKPFADSSLLHYPELTECLKPVSKVIKEAADHPRLFARLTNDCQELLERYLNEEEKFSPDDLLKKIHSALGNASFRKGIQSLYQAVIIDEFQDTDPLQWTIFSTLFMTPEDSWIGYLYLVGDPKQSIYSFRQADIYTYLEAAQSLGESSRYSLNVNYRSQPHLVEALNTIFSPDIVPTFIFLPKNQLQLDYQTVHASPSKQPFVDEWGAIHFMIAEATNEKAIKIEALEDSVFFPFILNEIWKHKREKNYDYRQFAILVRDRHQAKRLADFFKKHQVPYNNQRGTSLISSPMMVGLIDVLRALINPRDIKILRAALGSSLLGGNFEKLHVDVDYEKLISQLLHLRHLILTEGFGLFYHDLLQSRWLDSSLPLAEELLSREDGLALYRDLEQLADLIIDHQVYEWRTLEELILFLDGLKEWENNDDERIKRLKDPTENSVKILTLHYSKGLEFDIVFALGLANRKQQNEPLFSHSSHQHTLQLPSLNHPEEYLKFREECDAEKMRQLYVALTRAKHQLYVPYIQNASDMKLEFGEASPMDLFIARMGIANVTYEGLYDRIHQGNFEFFKSFLMTKGKDHHLTFSIHSEVPLQLPPLMEKNAIQRWVPQEAPILNAPKMMMRSFTSIQKSHDQEIVLSGIKGAPNDWNAAVKSIHTLPAGAETGVLLHRLFEKIDFKQCINECNLSNFRDHLRRWVADERLVEWVVPLFEIVSNTLSTRIKVKNREFSIHEIEEWHQYREMPFVFSNSEETRGDLGFIKGVMDLVFVHEGCYYIVDWKSNWLGQTGDAYQQDHLYEAMNHHQYHLQADIYKEALKRFLTAVSSTPFDEMFGGVIYLFVRGIQPGSQHGIYIID